MFDRPFLGSVAVVAGILTRAELRGPRFGRLFTDVYVAADVEVDLALRSRAAHLATGAVLGGWSAAELLGASCGPADAAVEIIAPGGRTRPRGGLVVRGDRLAPDEVTTVGGVPVTTPIRTAFDLARRRPLVEAVVAVDALTHAFDFAPQDVVTFGYRYVGARGAGRLPEVVRLANPLAESPMETRIRFAIHEDGLVAPVLQHPVGPYYLDMAYPGIRLGVEYDGREHLDQERAMRDLGREAFLGRTGWYVLRFGKRDVLHRPWRVAAKVRGKLMAAARQRELMLHEFDPR